MPKSRRMVTVVTEDQVSGSGGRHSLWGYGMRWLAAKAKVSVHCVRVAVSWSRGTEPALDPSDPVASVAWILERRGHPGLAQRVRAALSEDA